jgi:hypothetical protein
MLACIAEVYAKRHRLNHPARAAYRNITKGNWPDGKYQDYRSYLPESFLVASGLLPTPSGDGSPDPSSEPDPGLPDPIRT